MQIIYTKFSTWITIRSWVGFKCNKGYLNGPNQISTKKATKDQKLQYTTIFFNIWSLM